MCTLRWQPSENDSVNDFSTQTQYGIHTHTQTKEKSTKKKQLFICACLSFVCLTVRGECCCIPNQFSYSNFSTSIVLIGGGSASMFFLLFQLVSLIALCVSKDNVYNSLCVCVFFLPNNTAMKQMSNSYFNALKQSSFQTWIELIIYNNNSVWVQLNSNWNEIITIIYEHVIHFVWYGIRVRYEKWRENENYYKKLIASIKRCTQSN